jgi:spermidine synthase
MPLHHLWHSLKAHLSPKVIEEAESEINGTIQVVDVMGNRRIMVGGYVQSGGFVEQLWLRSLERVKKQKNKFKPKQAAIFGFAGGSAARCLQKLWPEIIITAVDIDPVIVRLGKKYLATDTIPHLTIHIASVFDWIKINQSTFDIIVIDLFKGGAIPKEASSVEFLRDITPDYFGERDYPGKLFSPRSQ